MRTRHSLWWSAQVFDLPSVNLQSALYHVIDRRTGIPDFTLFICSHTRSAPLRSNVSLYQLDWYQFACCPLGELVRPERAAMLWSDRAERQSTVAAVQVTRALLLWRYVLPLNPRLPHIHLNPHWPLPSPHTHSSPVLHTDTHTLEADSALLSNRWFNTRIKNTCINYAPMGGVRNGPWRRNPPIVRPRQ